MSGTASIEELILHAKKTGIKTLALTDTNGMYGLIKFAKLCIEENIKPVLGAVIDNPDEPDINAIFLAKNNDGYCNLCKIITARKLNDDFTLEKIINKKPENLFVITSSLLLLQRVENQKNLYAELISTPAQKRNTRNVYEFCKANGIKFIASHPVYFLEKDDFTVHKTKRAISLNKNYDDLKESELIDENYYFKNPEELKKIWKTLPEATEATEYIAESCNVDLKFGQYKFPKYKLPEGESSSQEYLEKAAWSGLKIRYNPLTDAAIKRLKFEMEIVKETSFADYFLCVWDIVKEARRRGMMLLGRGSAANSIISYVLGFSEVDPVKYNLYFERFLNKSRSSPPDIDLDFSWKERDSIIRFVFEKHGYENVAMISTHVTFKARSAFRETAKAFGIADEEISRYSKYIPWADAKNLPNLSEAVPEARHLNLKIEPWETIIDIAVKIANHPRYLSIHPSGILITPEPITNFTALEYAKNKGLGVLITQPDMYGVEDLGLIKIDLLSQRSLGVLRDTMSVLESRISGDEI